MRPSSALLVMLQGCFYVTEAERSQRWDQDGDGSERPADCDDMDPGRAALLTLFADGDGDGFGDPTAPRAACGQIPGFVEDDGDCDDASPVTYPGAPERCDHRDNDCDEQIDEDLSRIDWYVDADGDGFGDRDDEEPVEDCAPPEGYAPDATDCDDADENVHPDAVEVCDNGIDENCRGGADEGC